MNVPALPGNSLALVFRPSQWEGVETTSIRSFNGIGSRARAPKAKTATFLGITPLIGSIGGVNFEGFLCPELCRHHMGD